MPTRFGQLIIGTPGAGKTTYASGMQQFLSGLGRDVAVVNLDPANEEVPYEAAISLSDLVSLDSVMDRMALGPNGGLVYCMEYLEANIDWLLEKIDGLGSAKYLVFDFPGQVELFTHCSSVQRIMQRLTKEDFRLTVINLIDAHHCSEPSKFISASLLALTMMVQLEMPHINVLSKVDLMEQFGALPFNLEFFMDLQDMGRLLPYLDAPPARPDQGEEDGDNAAALEDSAAHAVFKAKRRRLHAAVCELVDDYGLVSFETLNIQSAESVGRLLARVDKANGYVFGASECASTAEAKYASKLFSSISSDTEMNAERTLLVQERYSTRLAEERATEMPAPMQVPQSPALRNAVIVGSRVALRGLVAKPELNGLVGVVAGGPSAKTGRLAVRLDNGQGGVQGPFQLKPENLVSLDGGVLGVSAP